MNAANAQLDRLNSFHYSERADALESLLKQSGGSAKPVGTNVNMHMHSFFSYNALGYSPTRIAWEARQAGLHAAGLCDFDVLDGLEEFLDAARRIGVRASVNLETRAYLKEYAQHEINSPGEPGVTYIMGAGFARAIAENTSQHRELTAYRDRARSRNVSLVGRINAKLPDIAVDYDRDVLPLTPAGVATERHIISAYIAKLKQVCGHADATASYIGKLLGLSTEEAAVLLADMPTLEEKMRAKLAKQGGLGYEQPSATTFPPVDDFVAWVRACDAIPMVTWLDGTSSGEKDGRAMLECLKAKGCAALNIIPDRNWNIKKAEVQAVKVKCLNEIVAHAVDMQLPVNIGTEMNKLGLPFVDDLDGTHLAPHKAVFLSGARIMVGQTLLTRYAGMSYISAKAATAFPEIKARNRFFEAVGALPPLSQDSAKRLVELGEEKALSWFREQCKTI